MEATKTQTEQIETTCETYTAANRAYAAADYAKGRLPGEDYRTAAARIRPIVNAAKAELIATCAANGLTRTYTMADGKGVISTCEAYASKEIGHVAIWDDFASFTPAKKASDAARKNAIRARVRREEAAY